MLNKDMSIFLALFISSILFTIFHPTHPWGAILFILFIFSPVWIFELSKLFYKTKKDLPEDSIGAFCNHIGIVPLSTCLRAIKKYNDFHVWLLLYPEDGGLQLSYDTDKESLGRLPLKTRVKSVGLGGIAWNDTDWEFGRESSVEEYGWECIDLLKSEFLDARQEHFDETKDEDPYVDDYDDDPYGDDYDEDWGEDF